MFRSASTVLAGMCFLMFGLCSAPKTKEASRQIKIQEEEVKVDLLYFGATWCPPCNQMKKIFKDKEIKKELDKYNFVLYDYDKDTSEAKKYKIKFLPTMIFKTDNKIMERKSGLLGKAQLLKILKKNSS
jgi:thiol-disulfide isomerase/thioredoxin